MNCRNGRRAAAFTYGACGGGLVAALLVLAPGAAAPPAPVSVDLEERVEVQLVLIDVVVLDRHERTVPGLSARDFDLQVDFKPVEIATFDARCPLGAAADPSAGDAPHAASPQARYVLVFDYYHLEHPAAAIERAIAALDRLEATGEIMLVSLGQVLRIEEPPTTDRERIRRGLERMEHDLDLYGGNYGRLTERRFFNRIFTLFDVTERMPGRKFVVLFSGPFLSDGFTYDPTFERIAAMAARSRTALYTVDAGGLRPDPEVRRGGPAMLRRLANETGGRPTADTNELGLGLARAMRDAGCVYTLGFYDDKPCLDRSRWLRVFVRRPGHRTVYPTSYVVRSAEKKRRSLVDSAAMLPELFASERLEADVSVVRPSGGGRWEAVATIGIAPDPAWPADGDAGWELRGELRKPNGTVVHSFKRQLQLAAARSTVLEALELRPGCYRLDVVLSHAGLATPLAATREVEIP